MSSIVPTSAKIKVSVLCMIGAGLLLTPALVAQSIGSKMLLTLALAAIELYAVWIFWPRWRFGLPCYDLPQSRADLKWALTFDDGPTKGVTDRILDILDQHSLKASFFALSCKATQNPDLIQRMIKSGHTVGLHGLDHQKAVARTRTELMSDLSRALAELQTITGQPVRLFRPSHGFKTLALKSVITELGLQFCFWDFGVWDTAATDSKTLVERLKIASKLPSPDSRRAPVILLHDGLGDEAPQKPELLLQSLELFLNELASFESLDQEKKPLKPCRN